MSEDDKGNAECDLIQLLQEKYKLSSVEALQFICHFVDSIRSAPVYDLTDKSKH